MNNFNITIVRDKCDVVVKINTDLPHEKGGITVYHFTHTCGSVQSAEFLKRYLDNAYKKTVESIRKAEFQSGWKQAKANKCGLSTFNWFYNHLIDEPSVN